jgi:putative ABC transport system permease protein
MRVIVSKRVADLLWPGERAVGRTITLWKGQGDPPGEVVGVVGNMRERGLASNPTLAVYLPYYGNDWSPIQLVVHAAGDPDALLTLLKQAVSRVDPRAPVAEGATLDSIVSGSLASRRLITGLLGGFAAVALTLALVGIYGVLAYMVSRRTAEIGMRMALGASRGSVVRLVVTQGLRPVCAGIVVGLLASLALSSLIARLLFGVEPNDPITYVGLAILLAAAAAAACIVPAHHASTLDVTTALRAE